VRVRSTPPSCSPLRETPRREKEGVQAATGAEATPTRRGEARRGREAARDGAGAAQALRRLLLHQGDESNITFPSISRAFRLA
jgi:hypothetical protein